MHNAACGQNLNSEGAQLNAAVADQHRIWAQRSKRHRHLGGQVLLCNGFDSYSRGGLGKERLCSCVFPQLFLILPEEFAHEALSRLRRSIKQSNTASQPAQVAE